MGEPVIACRGNYDSEDILKQRSDEINRLTAYLCAVLSIMCANGYYGLLHKINERESGVSKLEIDRWRDIHKAADAQRRKKEEEKIKSEQLREKVMKKLAIALENFTEEERSALNL